MACCLQNHSRVNVDPNTRHGHESVNEPKDPTIQRLSVDQNPLPRSSAMNNIIMTHQRRKPTVIEDWCPIIPSSYYPIILSFSVVLEISQSRRLLATKLHHIHADCIWHLATRHCGVQHAFGMRSACVQHAPLHPKA